MYKFNNGEGAVICNKCKVIIDSGLSYDEYKEYYGGIEEDFCWKCVKGKKKKKREEEN